MQHRIHLPRSILGTLVAASLVASAMPGYAEPPRFEPIANDGTVEIFLWRDVANVYVLRDGEAAMMIDIGDGSAAKRLGDLGVRRLEWCLLTHHHREQCQGHAELKAWKPQVGAPEKERGLLEHPESFRKLRPTLGDAFSVHGASYVRPPVEPLKIDRGFKTMDTFTWHGREFWCLETAGNSPGSMSYLLKTDRGWLAFGPNHSPNFSILLADSGRALMIDCGVDRDTLDATVAQMRERLGLKAIDAVLITHMHGDHVLGAPHARDKWGAKIWTLDRVAEKIQEPERFEYAALPWSYSPDVGPIRIDRVFRAGEKFRWEGYELTVDWMPGQTEFGCAIQGMIDGKRVAFTGDNLFADPDDPRQDGHEAVCARNSAILEEGHIYGADYLRRLQPDLLMGGHSYVMDRPKALIERYHSQMVALRDAYRELSDEEDYRMMFDPYWVRADPYRVKLARSGNAAVTIHVRNFRHTTQPYRIAVHTPQGLTAEPEVLEGVVQAEATVRLPLRLKANEQASPGVRIVALDTTLGGKRYGEWFDLIVGVSESKTAAR